MARRGPHLPDALIGLRPALLDGGDEVFDEAPVARRQRGIDLAELMDELEYWAEDVELDLVVGGVADPHRT